MLRSSHQAGFGMQKVLLLLFAVTPAVADVGAISVEVVDAVTRRPVDGVTITAERASPARDSAVIVTPSTGRRVTASTTSTDIAPTSATAGVAANSSKRTFCIPKTA